MRASHVEHLAGAKDRGGRLCKAGLESMAKGQIWLSTSFFNKVLLAHSHTHLFMLFLYYGGRIE